MKLPFLGDKAQFGVLPVEIMGSRLSDNAKIIYCCIEMFYNKRLGYAYPTNIQIGHHTGRTEQQVKRGIRELTDAGYIYKETFYDDEKGIRTRRIFFKSPF